MVSRDHFLSFQPRHETESRNSSTCHNKDLFDNLNEGVSDLPYMNRNLRNSALHIRFDMGSSLTNSHDMPMASTRPMENSHHQEPIYQQGDMLPETNNDTQKQVLKRRRTGENESIPTIASIAMQRPHNENHRWNSLRPNRRPLYFSGQHNNSNQSISNGSTPSLHLSFSGQDEDKDSFLLLTPTELEEQNNRLFSDNVRAYSSNKKDQAPFKDQVRSQPVTPTREMLLSTP